MAGYSATPLAKKLGIKEGFVISLVNAPAHYRSLFTDWPADITQSKKVSDKKDFIHYFALKAGDMERDIILLKEELKPAGKLWISWPKKVIGGCYKYYRKHSTPNRTCYRPGRYKSLRY